MLFVLRDDNSSAMMCKENEVSMNTNDMDQTFVEKYVRQDSKAYYFLRALCIFPAYLLYRPRYKGKENIPVEGAVILASNHLHLTDDYFTSKVSPC